MSQSTMDILYVSFIILVVIGGAIAIAILTPKENRLREEKKDCYRCFIKDGRLILTGSKPSLFENLTGKPLYIAKGPFEIEIFLDGLTGKDGKSYRAGAVMQLYLPESSAESAAEYLYGVLNEFSQETIHEALKTELTGVLTSAVSGYDSETDMKVFTADFRETVINKLSVFGYDLYCPPTLKIAPEEVQ